MEWRLYNAKRMRAWIGLLVWIYPSRADRTHLGLTICQLATGRQVTRQTCWTVELARALNTRDSLLFRAGDNVGMLLKFENCELEILERSFANASSAAQQPSQMSDVKCVCCQLGIRAGLHRLTLCLVFTNSRQLGIYFLPSRIRI